MKIFFFLAVRKYELMILLFKEFAFASIHLYQFSALYTLFLKLEHKEQGGPLETLGFGECGGVIFEITMVYNIVF